MDFKLDERAASRQVNRDRHLYSDSPLDAETEFIVRESGLPWLRLDIEFPWREMLAEAEALTDKFVEARYPGQSGWMLLSLHGLATRQVESYQHFGYRTEEECDHQWTEAGLACPVTKAFFTDVWPYSRLYRLRLAKLIPGGFIDAHCDYADHHLGPVNFALSQPKASDLVFKGAGPVPYLPGSAFILDVGREHQAFNRSNEDRIHIICHGVWAPPMQDLIKRSYQRQRTS